MASSGAGTGLTPDRAVLLAAVPLALATPAPVPAQTIPPGVEVEVVRIGPGTGSSIVALENGESIAVWIENTVQVGRPRAGGLPVSDAAAGEIIARFDDSAPFAWPVDPIVWTAPRDGSLRFSINATAAHAASGGASVTLVRLGPPGSRARLEFEPPMVSLDRVDGGVRVRYADRSGFGLDPATLKFTITTADGLAYDRGPWRPPRSRETTLPLPPPGVPLSAGVHRLEAWITDRVGNDAPRAVFLFDTGRQPATPAPGNRAEPTEE